MQGLARYLSEPPAGYEALGDVSWILGDPGGGSPRELPYGFIVPVNEVPAPRTGGAAGIDMNEHLVEIVLVDDLSQYGDPRPVAGEAYLEQWGYRSLITYATAVLGALRANITLGGLVARTYVRASRYTPMLIDTKAYRACRMEVGASQRRARA